MYLPVASSKHTSASTTSQLSSLSFRCLLYIQTPQPGGSEGFCECRVHMSNFAQPRLCSRSTSCGGLLILLVRSLGSDLYRNLHVPLSQLISSGLHCVLLWTFAWDSCGKTSVSVEFVNQHQKTPPSLP